MTRTGTESIERRRACSLEEFQEAYVRTSTPVIFTDMMDDWPARRLWSLDYFQSKFGTARMTVAKTRAGRLDVSTREGIPQEEMEFGRYIDLIREGSSDYYMITPIDERLPELLDDVVQPEICARASWTSSRLWISGNTTGTPLHQDLPENFYPMVFGRKKVYLVPPSQARDVYLHGRLSGVPNFCQTDLENPDYERFPRLRNVDPLVFTVEGGEVLYIPRLWFHQLRASEVTASLALWWANGLGALVSRVSHAYARMRQLREVSLPPWRGGPGRSSLSITLDERRRALEAAFFRKEDARLIERMHTELEERTHALALASLCGVEDADTLIPLVRQGIQIETFAALVLVPLVVLAWADDELSLLERQEILADAEDYGIQPGGVCREILDRWLESRPGPELFEAWLAYAQGLASVLPEDEVRGLEGEIMKRARGVAKADGGVLRIGRRISKPEQEVLERLEKAFQPS